MKIMSTAWRLFRGAMGGENKLCAILAVLLTVLVFMAGQNKLFDHDEFEHAHSAWYVAQGYVPYLDFFQNHNPLLWYIAAPLVVAIGDHSYLMLILRLITFGVALGMAAIAAAIAVRISSKPQAGLYAFILLLSCLLFVEKALEFRPDVFMTLLGSMAVYYFIRRGVSPSPSDLVLCGAFCALSFLFLQKAIFLVVMLSVCLMVQAARREIRMKSLLWFFLILGTAPLLLLIFFVAHDAGQDYIHNTYLMHLSKLYTFSSWPTFLNSLKLNTGFWALALLGSAFGLYRFRQDKAVGYLSAIGLALLLLVSGLQTPWEQYYLQALVLLAAVASWMLMRLFEKIRAGVFLRFFILVILVLLPVLTMLRYRISGNRHQLEAIDLVAQTTRPDELVYDGDILFNLFRSDLHYFWYSTHPGGNLDLYNKLTRGKYGDYSVCSLIEEKKPRWLSTYQHLHRCPVYRNYRKDKKFNLYRRIEGQ